MAKNKKSASSKATGSSWSKLKIAYWIVTGIFVVFYIWAATTDLFPSQAAKDSMAFMKLPLYLLPLLGVAKLLGAIAVAVPGFPRIREWAQAGITINFVGAIYIHLVTGPWIIAMGAFIYLVFATASYVLYRKLQARGELK